MGDGSATSRRWRSLGPDGTGTVTARVRPEAVPADDLLAGIDGATNALVFQASPVGEVTIIGPGAGPHLAGQGVLATSSQSHDSRQGTRNRGRAGSGADLES